MNSADFTRKNQYIVVAFLEVMQYIVKMKKKWEILLNFWLAEKNTKTYEIDFSNQRKKERKKERKAKIGEVTSRKQWK